ncbi:MAG: phage tail protein [Clostridia bacterium]
MANEKRIISFRDPHMALLIGDLATGTTYEKPIKIGRGIKGKISPKFAAETFRSDDEVEEQVEQFQQVDVELEVNALALENYALVRGLTVVKGEIQDNGNDRCPELAFGFRAKKTDGTYRYVWLLRGKFECPDEEYETLKDKPEGKTITLKGTFYCRKSDNLWRLKGDESSGMQKTRIDGWFTSVAEPLPAVTPPATPPV